MPRQFGNPRCHRETVWKSYSIQLADSRFLQFLAAAERRSQEKVRKIKWQKWPLERVGYNFRRTHFSAPDFSASNPFHPIVNAAHGCYLLFNALGPDRRPGGVFQRGKALTGKLDFSQADLPLCIQVFSLHGKLPSVPFDLPDRFEGHPPAPIRVDLSSETPDRLQSR